MLCLMHESPRRGYLQHVNGGPVSPEQLGRMTGCQPDRVAVLLSELESVGVFSRAERDVIFNRRMARDENKRALCQEAGKLGGNPALTLKGGVKGGSKGPPNPPPTPSSSSSSSSSSSDKSQSVCVTREPARISAEPPKLPPMPSAMAWSEAREKIMAAFPPSESPASPKAVAMAVDRLTMYGDSAIFPDNRPAAIDYLLVRVKAWANSPKCKSTEPRYRPGMAKWFGEEMYLAPDSDWAVAAVQRPANGKPAEDDTGARNAEAALAEIRKERELNGKR